MVSFESRGSDSQLVCFKCVNTASTLFVYEANEAKNGVEENAFVYKEKNKSCCKKKITSRNVGTLQIIIIDYIDSISIMSF